MTNDTQTAHRIAVLISGRGSNLQALLDAIRDGRLPAELRVVISNSADAQGLERAKKENVETLVLDHRDKVRFPSRDDYDRALVEELKKRGVEVVCHASQGSALVMRPLLLHASSKSKGYGRRRVLHFVFGPRSLPYGLRWQLAI